MRIAREIVLYSLPPCDRCRSRAAVMRWGGDNRPARDIQKEILLCQGCAELLRLFLAGHVVPGGSGTQ